MSAAAPGDAAPAGARHPGRRRREPGDAGGNGRGPSRGILITIIGAVVSGGIAAATLAPGRTTVGEPPAGTSEPSLMPLAPADIPAALPTLDPVTAKAAVDDAKSCKAPLAWVTLAKRPGSRGGMVRIASGAYVSPPIQLTDVRQRVATPYPAPYPTGRGVLSLLGDANEVWVQLYPGWFVPTLSGTASVNVHWTPRNPC